MLLALHHRYGYTLNIRIIVLTRISMPLNLTKNFPLMLDFDLEYTEILGNH